MLYNDNIYDIITIYLIILTMFDFKKKQLFY